MADDDIDIDIYGDDRPATAVDENFELDLDEPQDGPPVDEVLPNAPSEHHNSSQSQTPTPNVSTVRTPAHHGHQDQITAQNRLPGATALRMNELYWWVNEDTVRSWINASQLETEVVEIAFAEHRENGKSKGYALRIIVLYTELTREARCGFVLQRLKLHRTSVVI